MWIRIRGSMPLTNRSGSGFGSGSFYFYHWPSRSQQKTYFFKSFSAYYVCYGGTFTSFFKDKKIKKNSQNSRNQGFSSYFCLMIEGSRPGSIPLTHGSGSGSRRPKNMWIRIRIRIRNTAGNRDWPGLLDSWGWGCSSPWSRRGQRRGPASFCYSSASASVPEQSILLRNFQIFSVFLKSKTIYNLNGRPINFLAGAEVWTLNWYWYRTSTPLGNERKWVLACDMPQT